MTYINLEAITLKGNRRQTQVIYVNYQFIYNEPHYNINEGKFATRIYLLK